MSRSRILRSALALVLIALLAATAVLYLQHSRHGRDATGTALAVDAAAAQSVALLSYNPEEVEVQLRSAADGLAPSPFRDAYGQTSSEKVVPAAREQGISTEATVVGRSLVSGDTNTATVLLFINQSTTTAANPEPSHSGSRVLVTMSRVDGTWRIADFQPI
ncbi:hypothetical protein [Tomitella biformata]|uniref:hypothetical protein n=1 Tax=Tomitella biformata TaxID=630403 RepID=UPI000464CEC5|nr:hypothetical protein [Tomitella biformata]